MAEIAKPDYLSLVNKGGSGFNVSELVTSIVASEIEPKRILQTSKLEKTENAISGIGYLNSQSATTQSNFSTITGDSFFAASSSMPQNMTFVATDETKLTSAIRTISDVQVAQKMVFELPGFSLTDTFTETLSIELGEWSQSSFASETILVRSVPVEGDEGFVSGKTYVEGEVEADKTYQAVFGKENGTGSAFAAFTRDPHDPSATGQYLSAKNSGVTPQVEEGVYFRTSSNFDSGAYHFQEVDNYTFTKKSGTSAININTTGSTLTLSQMVSLIDAVDGISAQIVQKSENSSNYSVIITSENTGAENGFKIASSLSGNDGQRWQTSLFSGTNTAYGNQLAQSARNLEFKLDGVEISRSQNTVTDLIEGGSLQMIANFSGNASLNIARSESNIRQSIEDTIFSLNEFKTEIDRLTYIDVDGDANGPLAMETSATMLKSNFKKLALEPLKGYGSELIYLSQLGIKTNSSGEYYLDEATFSKTLANNPGHFAALKDANLSSNSASATVTKSQFTNVPADTYTVTNDTGQWKLGDTNLTQENLDSGGSRFTSVSYPGLVIETTERTPADFEVYIGKSFSQKIIDLMTETLDLESSLKSTEESYKTLTFDIEARLEKLEIRETLITDRYTEQFGSMEQSMSQFNSTKSLLENFVEAWKKQK
jgi:flagellar hook-associated protein 2